MSKLPNAPLTEVVFELRWDLHAEEGTPAEFKQDPGYGILLKDFTDDARKKGFLHSQKVNASPNFQIPLFAYRIDRRFMKSEKNRFPLWQLGPGIFAANQSDEYDWPNFKKLCVEGLSLLHENYPISKTTKISPIRLELRYIDVFDLKYLEKKSNLSIQNFINNWTNLSLNFDESVVSGISKGGAKGAINLIYDLDEIKEGRFVFDISSGKRDTNNVNENIIHMETRVISSSDALGLPKEKNKQIQHISKWLDDSHIVLKDFFKQILKEELHAKFTKS